MRVAIFSTYPPRPCGIGTFAFDVRTSLLAVPGVKSVGAIAVVDEASSPQRPDVLATVSQAVRGDYIRAARLLGRLDVDVVLLQHEYGIFGGADGEYVLSFARELTRPLVLTLHTVLSEPTDHQREVLTALCEEAERVIVMTETARELLLRTTGSAVDKIRVVQHGAPAILGRRNDNGSVPSRGLDRLRARFVLSTFGLISPGKGIETAIAALPGIVERHPQVLYLIAGRTHPEVARLTGEQYRLLLERRAVDLGVADHVEFDDRFLSVPELADVLHATDVFLTPYRNPEQIASGALTFALAAGCAAISTPYLFAKDMLATGAGRLVPFDDAAAIENAVCDFIESPESLVAARAEARRIGAELFWPAIAAETAVVLQEAAVARPRPRADSDRRARAHVGQNGPSPDPGRRRRDRPTRHRRDPKLGNGLLRRRRRPARGRRARAKRADAPIVSGHPCSIARSPSCSSPQGPRAPGCGTSWATTDAGSTSRMSATMSAERSGRSARSLRRPGFPLSPDRRGRCSTHSCHRSAQDVSLRTAAYTILGLARLDPDRLDHDARELLERLVEQLASAYRESAGGSWLWFEDRLTYDNARLSQALIVGGSALRRHSDVAIGLESLAWLGDECGLDNGVLRLPGHHGRRSRRAGARGR